MRLLFFSLAACAGIAGGVGAQELSPLQIMKNVDEVIYAPKDKASNLTFILIDKDGSRKEREVESLEKGSTHRLVKYLSPADQKGIGFLSLPKDVMYVYLPAFKKVRRIASSVKNGKFGGTDLTYEDMEAKLYSETWDAVLTKQDETNFYLDLKPKPTTVSDYGKIALTVRKDIFYPVQIQYFDKGGNYFKVMKREKLEKIDGFWVSKETTVEDFKTGHKTILAEKSIKFNANIPDERFSDRYLTR